MRRFSAAGIDPARVELRGYSSHRRMLEEYSGIDVVLDTFPYNGGITTLEAMWMGKPVVTIRGDTLISRQSAALLDAVGLSELAAGSASEFARTVASLAADPKRLASDAPSLARALEAAYRAAWKEFIAATPRRI